ncbi:CCR4-NOT transcription complex subunit 2-like isoform X2 [Rhopilema esculentum]|uniref:CCR4-NOT transcription complex subunit 2-like isoform X2 n=1 Tax=Rhopilema esculentum TaxID=499914 RepID=UPI0031DDE557
MSVGGGFGDNILGMNQFQGSYRKQPQDLSPGGRKPNLGSGFGHGKQGYKMGMYKDENETEEDFNNPLLSKPGFPQRPSDRDISQQMSQLSLYGSQSDPRVGTWNGSGQTFDDPRSAAWNGGQSLDDVSADLWRSTSQPGGVLPMYSSGQMTQTSRGQISTTQFSRSFSTPPIASGSDRFGGLSGTGMPPISTGFHHSSSSTSGQTSPGRNGLLSMGGRSTIGQQLPSSLASNSQSQSAINNSIQKTGRTAGLPSVLSSGSRSSPNLLPLGLTQPVHQQQVSQIQTSNQQPNRVGSFGSLSSLSGGGPLSGIGTRPFSSSGSQGGLLGQLQNVSAGHAVSSLQSTMASVFSGSSDNLTQPIGSGISNFDVDFPALANRGASSSSSPSSSQSASLPSRTGYGGALQNHDLESFVMVTNKSQDSVSEFQIQNEDFPALPGSSQSDSSLHQENKSLVYQELLMSSGSSYESVVKDGRPFSDKKSRTPGSAGIQTSSSGVITNIPVGMVTDQFGMIGLLTFIRAAETEPNLVTLALGSDLTTLGLNLNSTESLYHTFGSPFSDTTCRPHEIDFYVPPEYLVNTTIRDRLANIRLNRYGEDLLFYLYYTNCGDILQLAAAAELYSRDWRYHKEERVWITRAPGMDPQVKTSSYERGMYYCFDYHSWRKVPKEFHVDYDKLEEKPTLGSVA